jgi:hypothetical protein
VFAAKQKYGIDYENSQCVDLCGSDESPGSLHGTSHFQWNVEAGSGDLQLDAQTMSADGKTMHVRFDNTQGYVQEQTGHKVE